MDISQQQENMAQWSSGHI